jgi:hypothetical protein
MGFYRRLSPGLTGWLSGLLVPMLTLLLLIYFFVDGAWDSKINTLEVQNRMGAWISLGAIPNLLLFTFWIRKKKDVAAQGVLGATFFWAILTLFYTFN